MAGAAVDGHGKLALDDTAPVPVDASDDAPETFERRLQFEDVLTPPPEGVSLRGKRRDGSIAAWTKSRPRPR